MSDHDDHLSPGTVGPATTTKAGCGIRYAEDELREGIDFSGAVLLRIESEDDTEVDQHSSVAKQINAQDQA